MSGLFLGPLRPEDLLAVEREPVMAPDGAWFVASGHDAIRLLLRHQRLQPGARVALPALICPTVVSAICAEGLMPDFVDIEPDLCVMSFDENVFARRGFDLILLPHLYGLPHPRTREIRDFARNAGIPLIHDAAQSYGVCLDGKPLVNLDQGGVYSFGPGKATTAATGALVYGLSREAACLWGLDRLARWDPEAHFFMRQRMGLPGRSPSWGWLVRRGLRGSRIQAQAGHRVMRNFSRIEAGRRANWEVLRQWLGTELMGTRNERCSYYKFVFKTPNPEWCPPPEWAVVPWRRVVRHPTAGDLPHYGNPNETLIELSTERSLAEYRTLAAEQGRA
ncbi:MAG: DegT/DnrJ/EryC1/StrS aminotransferase family protein [Magnetococcales bacterium]|nr:DegT/DnrJ/EryC1/StrS aminotransferase family protein [Magnetococcales bacterium]